MEMQLGSNLQKNGSYYIMYVVNLVFYANYFPVAHSTAAAARWDFHGIAGQSGIMVTARKCKKKYP